MYELYIGNKNYSSWSMRPWVLMRQLGIGFREQLRPFHLNRGEGDFRKFSPSGKVPLLVQGEVRVWDSLAIAEFLAERHQTGDRPRPHGHCILGFHGHIPVEEDSLRRH